MKNFKPSTDLKVALFGLLLVTLVFSCETEEMEPLQNSVVKTKAQTALRVYEDCATVCLEADSDDYFIKSENQTGGNKNHNKSVSYFAYNTQTDFVVKVSFDITTGTAGTQSDIIINIEGNEILVEDVPSGGTATYSISLAEGWAACDLMEFTVRQEGLGNPIEFYANYALIGVCPEACEESFSYEVNEDNSYTFTYISEEDVMDAQVKFTAPHISDFTSLDGKTYTSNPGNGQGSPTVLTYNGDIEACTPITFVLSFEADCNQNSAGFANLFTDFKVNGISKKGDNENIRYNCNN